MRVRRRPVATRPRDVVWFDDDRVLALVALARDRDESRSRDSYAADVLNRRDDRVPVGAGCSGSGCDSVQPRRRSCSTRAGAVSLRWRGRSRTPGCRSSCSDRRVSAPARWSAPAALRQAAPGIAVVGQVVLPQDLRRLRRRASRVSSPKRERRARRPASRSRRTSRPGTPLSCQSPFRRTADLRRQPPALAERQRLVEVGR